MNKGNVPYREEVKLISIPYTVEITNSFAWLLGPDHSEFLLLGHTFLCCKAERSAKKEECVILFKPNKLGFFFEKEIRHLKDNTRIVGKSIIWEYIVEEFQDPGFKLV